MPRSTPAWSGPTSTPPGPQRGHLDPGKSPASAGAVTGGLTTKLHTVCDGRGRNLATRLTPGQDADTSQLVGLVDQVRVARPGGRGRPRRRPDHLTADKANSSRANGAALRAATSRTRSLSATIRRPTAPVVVPVVAGRQPSTESVTATAIRWSG